MNDSDAAFWKLQATCAFEDMDKLSEGIAKVYTLLGLTEQFTVAHNPAHNQLEAIIKKLETP